MLIYRTDSDRTPREDERTKLLTELLKYKLHDDLAILFNGVNDHKGGLFVYWKIEPNKEQIDMVNESWVCLHENFVEHYYHGKIIFELNH
jgi:hypothetical protein